MVKEALIQDYKHFLFLSQHYVILLRDFIGILKQMEPFKKYDDPISFLKNSFI